MLIDLGLSFLMGLMPAGERRVDFRQPHFCPGRDHKFLAIIHPKILLSLSLRKSRGGTGAARTRNKRCRSRPLREATAKRWKSRHRGREQPGRKRRNAASG